MDEQRKKAFEFASDLTKQLITLATGILAITITFSKDIVRAVGTQAAVPRCAVFAMMIAWVVYLFSIGFGIWTLMALTGELEPRGEKATEPTTKNFNVFLPTVLQIGAFILATAAVIVFGAVSILQVVNISC
jgi:hypothetical protein